VTACRSRRRRGEAGTERFYYGGAGMRRGEPWLGLGARGWNRFLGVNAMRPTRKHLWWMVLGGGWMSWTWAWLSAAQAQINPASRICTTRAARGGGGRPGLMPLPRGAALPCPRQAGRRGALAGGAAARRPRRRPGRPPAAASRGGQDQLAPLETRSLSLGTALEEQVGDAQACTWTAAPTQCCIYP
jgi:hypothetical protein